MKHDQHAPPRTTGPEFYPILLKPVYKDYVWGGTRIPRIYHREEQHGICAESWEVSDRPEGMSIVTNGRHTGKSLHELVMTMGAGLVGTAGGGFDVFPLLIKILDAKQRLSLQVHPSDQTAARYGGEPKTETWYVLDAEPGSCVFAGLVHGVNRKGFQSALERQEPESVLQPIPAEKGKTVFIPGGRVHAVGEGCLLLEVQQNSNTTYRVYDWGRVGNDGRPRELHTEQAFQCINWRDKAAPASHPRRLPQDGPNHLSELIETPYFKLVLMDLTAEGAVEHDGQTFSVIFVAGGHVAIESNGVVETIGTGTSCLLPAALKSYTMTPVSKAASVIRISLL